MSGREKILILVIQLLFCAVCSAQRGKIDSLNRILSSLRDSSRVDCLNMLGSIYTDSYIDTAQTYTEQAYTEASRLDYTEGIAHALINLAVIESTKANFVRAEELVQKAISLLEKSRNNAGLG